MKAKLILLASTCVFLFGALEVALRFFYDVPPTWLEPQVRHLRSPLLGWVLPPGGSAYTIDAPVQVNQLGLRDDEFPIAKPPGEIRILCLGDSFTFALGVRFEDLYSEQLERLLKTGKAPGRFQVVNAGVAGYNTRQELIYLLKSGFGLEPDLITVGFYWNDLLGNDEELPDLENTPVISGVDDWKETHAHTLPPWIRDPLRQSLVLYLGVRLVRSFWSAIDPPMDPFSPLQRAILSGDSDFIEPYWTDTAHRLGEISVAARERGIPVVLMAFPMENQVRLDYPEAEYGERLRELWRPTGMPFIDLEPAYKEAVRQGENPFLPYDLHPNVAGMRIAAEALYDVIEERSLLPNEGP